MDGWIDYIVTRKDIWVFLFHLDMHGMSFLYLERNESESSSKLGQSQQGVFVKKEQRI